jgi:hypothetical protein
MDRFQGTVYHGSNSVFTKFDPSKARIKNDFFGGGVGYFTDSMPIGIQYARSMSKGGGSPILYTCNVTMRKMFDTEDTFVGDDLIRIMPDDVEGFARGSGLLRYGNDRIKVITDLKSGKVSMKGVDVFRGLSSGMNQTAKARAHLASKGYDGLRYAGGTITGAVRHWVYLPYRADSIELLDGQIVDFMKAA